MAMISTLSRRFLRIRWSSKRSFAWPNTVKAIFTGSLEFKAKLCSAKQNFALNSNRVAKQSFALNSNRIAKQSFALNSNRVAEQSFALNSNRVAEQSFALNSNRVDRVLVPSLRSGERTGYRVSAKPTRF
jgi:hypothetical protein